MNSVINLDLLKLVRGTVDWVKDEYKGIINSQKKARLNKVANQITTLAVNKAAYLSALKHGLNAETESIDLPEIKRAIQTAQSDTEKLKELLTEFNLDTSKYTFSLKYGLEKLTEEKVIKVKKLEELLLKDMVGLKEVNQIINELESFEQKWVELGKEIDEFIEKKL